MAVTQTQVDWNGSERAWLAAKSSLKYVLKELSVILFVEDSIKNIKLKKKEKKT